LTFKVGHNKFSHYSNYEYKRLLGRKSTNIKKKNVEVTEILDVSDLPTSVDWRTKGAVNPVQDQADCGSCWAFSSVAAIEGSHAIKTGELLKLSEQQVLDCDTRSGGCYGGLEINAFEYAEENPLELEKDYPYDGAAWFCDAKKAKEIVGVASFKQIPDRSVSQLKASIAIGPTSVAVDATSKSWHLYQSGIFNDPSCGISLDHAVLAVGYGIEDDQEYVIIRNSWSADWGEEGYIRLAFGEDGDGMCGVLKESSRPTAAN